MDTLAKITFKGKEYEITELPYVMYEEHDALVKMAEIVKELTNMRSNPVIAPIS